MMDHILLYGCIGLKYWKLFGFMLIFNSWTHGDPYHTMHMTHNENEIIFALNLPYDNLSSEGFRRLTGTDFNTAKHYASAAAIAVHDINQDPHILHGYTLKYLWNATKTNTQCLEVKAVHSQVNQIIDGVHAFIGFRCFCLTVAKNAAAFNLPLISDGCSEMELSDKDTYPTFARTTPQNIDIIYLIRDLLHIYNWQKVAILYEESHSWKTIFHRLMSEANAGKINVTIKFALGHRKDDAYNEKMNYEGLDHVFEPFLEKLPSTSRIVLLLMDVAYIREFMLMAAKRNLVGGDYIFIAVNPLVTKPVGHGYIYWWLPTTGKELDGERNDQDYNKAVLEKAYRNMLIISPEKREINGAAQQRFNRFEEEVTRRLNLEPFNVAFTYDRIFRNFTDEIGNRTIKPPPEASNLYDAVMIYALGLNKTLSQGKPITDGKAIIDNVKGMKFDCMSGVRCMMNSKADILVSLTVSQFQFGDDGSDVGTVVWKTDPRCYNSCYNLEFKFEPVNPVHWVLGRVPKDAPDCGFYGELCPHREYKLSKAMLAMAVSVSILACIAVIVPVFFYRQYKLKRDLTSLLWKIDLSELYFHDWKSDSASSLGSLTSHSAHFPMGTGNRQKFTTVAIYKGMLVAVKTILKRNVELNKDMLIELKLARDVHHDNLNPFIGASVEPGQIRLVTQYGTKGSLQDVLENPEIKLDTLFILSLLHDITKGMLYLHSTDIKSHGNLKSSNCVIDGRWVLKITDFGLNTFRKPCRVSTGDRLVEPGNALLWRAPELLRLELPSWSRGSQKGDVYSFAIILQECHTREGAWSGTFMDPDAIIEKVKQVCRPPFRPIVSDLLENAESLRDKMMKRCWAENPDDRPSFLELKKDVEALMKANGLKTNIFDNMIYMMGKYSDSLEEIVEERTSCLIEEKRKVEALLERMLPRSVARQLVKGQPVEAETFEEVTIYFSDIVSFTSICGQLSAMEVVNVLNNLYTLFDNIIKNYDVYKVETIGDAYMVVSGLPIRNGQRHASEICLLAVDILEQVRTKRPGPADKPFQIRIGVHTGPVVAGVVGNTMPRYCLFGDTVNVASRMESHGEAMRIHISQSVRDALPQNAGYQIQERGETHIKGKGTFTTYWLEGAEKSLRHPRLCHRSEQPSLCHNAGMGETFHLDTLRSSPALRHNVKSPMCHHYSAESTTTLHSSRSSPSCAHGNLSKRDRDNLLLAAIMNGHGPEGGPAPASARKNAFEMDLLEFSSQDSRVPKSRGACVDDHHGDCAPTGIEFSNVALGSNTTPSHSNRGPFATRPGRGACRSQHEVPLLSDT